MIQIVLIANRSLGSTRARLRTHPVNAFWAVRRRCICLLHACVGTQSVGRSVGWSGGETDGADSAWMTVNN